MVAAEESRRSNSFVYDNSLLPQILLEARDFSEGDLEGFPVAIIESIKSGFFM